MNILPIFRDLGRDPAIRGRVIKLYALLLEELSFGEFRPIKQAYLAKRAGMRRPHVSRGLRQLVERGYVLEGDRVGRVQTYCLAQARQPGDKSPPGT